MYRDSTRTDKESESCEFLDCQECSKKEDSRDQIDTSLCFTGKLRLRSRKEWEFQECHTQNHDNTTHFNVCSEVCEQNEAIGNFEETFNLNKSTRSDIRSETIAGPVLYCQQTRFSTSKDVEKSDLGSSKGELEFDLTPSSGEPEVKLDPVIGEPEGK